MKQFFITLILLAYGGALWAQGYVAKTNFGDYGNCMVYEVTSLENNYASGTFGHALTIADPSSIVKKVIVFAPNLSGTFNGITDYDVDLALPENLHINGGLDINNNIINADVTWDYANGSQARVFHENSSIKNLRIILNYHLQLNGGIVVDNCVFEGSSTLSITDDNTPNDVIIKGCIFNTTFYGSFIHVYTSYSSYSNEFIKNINIINNEFITQNFKYSSIRFNGFVSNINIENNRFLSNGGSSLNLSGLNASSVIIKENKIFANNESSSNDIIGIDVRNTNISELNTNISELVIEHNTIILKNLSSNNQGIYLTGSNIDKCYIKKNTIYSSSLPLKFYSVNSSLIQIGGDVESEGNSFNCINGSPDVSITNSDNVTLEGNTFRLDEKGDYVESLSYAPNLEIVNCNNIRIGSGEYAKRNVFVSKNGAISLGNSLCEVKGNLFGLTVDGTQTLGDLDHVFRINDSNVDISDNVFGKLNQIFSSQFISGKIDLSNITTRNVSQMGFSDASAAPVILLDINNPPLSNTANIFGTVNTTHFPEGSRVEVYYCSQDLKEIYEKIGDAYTDASGNWSYPNPGVEGFVTAFAITTGSPTHISNFATRVYIKNHNCNRSVLTNHQNHWIIGEGAHLSKQEFHLKSQVEDNYSTGNSTVSYSFASTDEGGVLTHTDGIAMWDKNGDVLDEFGFFNLSGAITNQNSSIAAIQFDKLYQVTASDEQLWFYEIISDASEGTLEVVNINEKTRLSDRNIPMYENIAFVPYKTSSSPVLQKYITEFTGGFLGIEKGSRSFNYFPFSTKYENNVTTKYLSESPIITKLTETVLPVDLSENIFIKTAPFGGYFCVYTSTEVEFYQLEGDGTVNFLSKQSFPEGVVSLEFSPTMSYVYLLTDGGTKIKRILKTLNEYIEGTLEAIVESFDLEFNYNQLLLYSDERLYMNPSEPQGFISFLSNVDQNLRITEGPKATILDGKKSGVTLPNNFNFYLKEGKSAHFCPFCDQESEGSVRFVPLLYGLTSPTISWDFGDGQSSNEYTTSHTYADNNRYNATITATDIDGCVYTETLSVGTSFCCTGYLRISNSDFCAGETALISAGVRSTYTDVNWVFGQGQTGSGASTATLYPEPGRYLLEVEASGSDICPAISSQVDIQVDQCNLECKECIPSFSPVPGKEYVLSAWVNGTTGQINLIFEGAETTLGPFRPTGALIDGWRKIESRFIVPNRASAINIQLKNNSLTQNDVYFDDIRIYPVEANMKSFVYDPFTLRLQAEMDENNYATFYEYDKEGQLIRIKKETERGVMTIQETGNNLSKQ